ncbi:MAG TPA: nuclear transport factor 2 family protein [Bordetella sp.]
MQGQEQLLAFAQEYFEVLHTCDVVRAAKIFHPECGLFNVVEGKINFVPGRQYLEILKGRESPRSRGEPVYGKVLTIDQTDENTAFLKVLSSVQPRYFEDYLTLLREDGQWRVVAKVYRALAACRDD